MAIPPESHREPGFEELISKTLNMAASAKLDLLILTEYSQASRIKRSVENHGAELPVIVESVTLWEDLNLVLQNRVRKGDVILLNGARKERSEEHTSELQSRGHLVCRLLLEKKKILAYLVNYRRESR